MEKIDSSYGALFPNQKRKKSRSPQMLGSILLTIVFF